MCFSQIACVVAVVRKMDGYKSWVRNHLDFARVTIDYDAGMALAEREGALGEGIPAVFLCVFFVSFYAILYRFMLFLYRFMLFLYRFMLFSYRFMLFSYRFMLFLYRFMLFSYRFMLFLS